MGIDGDSGCDLAIRNDTLRRACVYAHPIFVLVMFNIVCWIELNELLWVLAQVCFLEQITVMSTKQFSMEFILNKKESHHIMRPSSNDLNWSPICLGKI